MKKNILICGDSFSCIWPIKNNNLGWSYLLKNDYEITNLSQAGVGEYKIYKQIKSQDLKKYYKIIVCHTSPYRISVENHPSFKKGNLHENADLIFTDIESRKFSSIKMIIIYYFFKYFFYKEYFEFIHFLIFKEIKSLDSKIIHISFFDKNYEDVIDLSKYFNKFKGDVNHLNKKGNLKVYKFIKKILK